MNAPVLAGRLAPSHPMLAPFATTPDIDTLIAAGAPVAIGVSGGKDSQAAALATFLHLDAVRHAGPRILVHSDLGEVEWLDSLPVCERLATHLSAELLVVRRAAGGLMERWEARWASSLRRYADLETVTLVLPWSTPAMRFCTAELKEQVIAPALKRRFPGQMVVNVTGVRREESAARARGSIASLSSKTGFWNWRPLSDWTKAEVLGLIAAHGLQLHTAYTGLGMSRVSCRFCIMSSAADLTAAAAASEAHGLYRRMVALEARSTFGFQGGRWLADVAPQLLDDEARAAVADAKLRAARRVVAESPITPGMLYEKGWPTRMLTDGEADILAGARRQVADLVGLDARCLDRATIHARYAELIAAKAGREARS